MHVCIFADACLIHVCDSLLRIFSVTACCSVRAAFHPAAFESSLARHKEDAAAAAQVLAADIRDGRYDPARPDFNQGQLDPAAEAAGGAAAQGMGTCISSRRPACWHPLFTSAELSTCRLWLVGTYALSY
jgi:hypothetical protein